MQIFCNAKYTHLFGVLLLLCVVRNAAQLHICNSNAYRSAQFLNNLNIVITDLVKDTSSSDGFNTSISGQSPDTVYGLLQCYGATTAKECLACSRSANTTIREICQNAKSGRLWLDKCYIHYDVYFFFGKLDTDSRTSHNIQGVTDKPDVFRSAVKELFTNLQAEALRSPILYSSGSTTPSTLAPIYGLVQCWRDITSAEDCKTCITNAIRDLLDATLTDEETFNGGMSCYGSCIARYETYMFFNPAPPQMPSPPILLPTASQKSGNKITIVLGIAGGLLVMLLLCLFAVRRKFKSALLWMPALLRKENLNREVDTAMGNEQEIIYTLENIKAATRNFHEDNKLGEGGFGSVYKGTMPNGTQIAVKRLSLQSSQGKKQFQNEVKLMATIQHRNLVNLLGCCTEGSERLLVYEFLSNTSLDKILFHPQRRTELDWKKRLNIILGVARGLLYLHKDSHFRIIHRDIKTSNILLDEEMQAKISDFGLARLFHPDETRVNTTVSGTLGYMAPEYALSGQLSDKADVYSFGIVFLEIICGRKNTDITLSFEFQSLLEWVWRSYNGGSIVDVIDKTIVQSFSYDQISRYIHVGLLCTQANASLRPPIDNIYAMLSNPFITNLPKPTKPAYISLTENNVPPYTTRTFLST